MNMDFPFSFHKLQSEIGIIIREYDLPVSCLQWIEDSVKYNCQGGKYTRGATVLDTFLSLSDDPEKLLEECFLLGWCVEMGAFLVADDVMDNSVTRRGKPCWFRREAVGLAAINDSFILKSLIFKILERKFKSLPFYLELVELFNEISLKTELGQLMDTVIPSDFTQVIMTNYLKIATFKTAFYSFYLPVVCGFILAGKCSSKVLEECQEILIPMGILFQAQDDFLDCYGDPQITGKIGTDIEDGKCTWLLCSAIERCNNSQLSLLKSNYGKQSKECMQLIKQIFDDLQIPFIFKEFEKDSILEIKGKIDEIPMERRRIYSKIADKIFYRNK